MSRLNGFTRTKIHIITVTTVEIPEFLESEVNESNHRTPYGTDHAPERTEYMIPREEGYEDDTEVHYMGGKKIQIRES